MTIDGGLAALFRQHLPDVHWQRVETGGTGRGIPDLNGCVDGAEFWLELKLATGWAVDLRPEQVGWILRRSRAGGRVWLAVRQRAPKGPRRAARDALWLVPGALAGVAAAQGLRGLEDVYGVQCWSARWDWSAVRAALVRAAERSAAPAGPGAA